MKTFPTLYKRTSTGATQQWEIWVEGDPFSTVNPAKIVTRYGQVDGAQQTAVDEIREGKNAGKVNETTPYTQAVAEAQSKWEGKKKRRYVEQIDAAEAGQVDTTVIVGGVAPMLAHVYEKQGHKIKFPAYAQPKLDGHRCIAVIVPVEIPGEEEGTTVWTAKCTLWSRTQKQITGLPHVVAALEKLANTHPVKPMTMTLDGELYNHDYKDRFEDLSSHIRSETPKPGHTDVQYWIYDVVVDLPFGERSKLLNELETLIGVNHLDPDLTVLATFEVPDEEALMSTFATFLGHGYEGAMVRNASGRYVGKRSYDLQKVKVMQDAEFEVVDIVAGRGKMADAAIFVCKTDKGDVFQCVMATSHKERVRYLRERTFYIGKHLTIKYQNISNYGIPRFPVALRFRQDA